MPPPFLCWMEKRRNVFIHTNNDGSYIVAVKKGEFLFVVYSSSTFFHVDTSTTPGTYLEQTRARAADPEVFVELKRIQAMATDYGVPLFKIALIHATPETTPEAVLEKALAGGKPETTQGHLFTKVLVEDVWERDHPTYVDWVQRGCMDVPNSWEDE